MAPSDGAERRRAGALFGFVRVAARAAVAASTRAPARAVALVDRSCARLGAVRRSDRKPLSCPYRRQRHSDRARIRHALGGRLGACRRRRGPGPPSTISQPELSLLPPPRIQFDVDAQFGQSIYHPSPRRSRDPAPARMFFSYARPSPRFRPTSRCHPAASAARSSFQDSAGTAARQPARRRTG